MGDKLIHGERIILFPPPMIRGGKQVNHAPKGDNNVTNNTKTDNGSNVQSKPTEQRLKELEAETVTAYTGEWPRNDEEYGGFPSGISINGELEYNRDRNQFRILVSKGNYTYFTAEDVKEVRAGEDVGKPDFEFQDGAKAVIRLQLGGEE